MQQAKSFNTIDNNHQVLGPPHQQSVLIQNYKSPQQDNQDEGQS
jgi:hypothetical protein